MCRGWDIDPAEITLDPGNLTSPGRRNTTRRGNSTSIRRRPSGSRAPSGRFIVPTTRATGIPGGFGSARPAYPTHTSSNSRITATRVGSGSAQTTSRARSSTLPSSVSNVASQTATRIVTALKADSPSEGLHLLCERANGSRCDSVPAAHRAHGAEFRESTRAGVLQVPMPNNTTFLSSASPSSRPTLVSPASRSPYPTPMIMSQNSSILISKTIFTTVTTIHSVSPMEGSSITGTLERPTAGLTESPIPVDDSGAKPNLVAQAEPKGAAIAGADSHPQ